MNELEVLRASYGETARRVERMAPADLTRPTPCADWDIRALLAHVVGATDGLVAMLRGEDPDWERDALGNSPATAVRASLDRALVAWAEEGAVDRPSQQMPGMRVVDFAMADAVLHAWDLAAAVGEQLELDDALAAVVLDRWSGAPAEQGRTYAVFGPRVDVPGDARALDRLLAETGRDPAWAPTG